MLTNDDNISNEARKHHGVEGMIATQFVATTTSFSLECQPERVKFLFFHK